MLREYPKLLEISFSVLLRRAMCSDEQNTKTSLLGCRFWAIINNLKTEPPLRHFTDQTTEATISKFGSGVLYSIRMKMGIIKSVLIKAFIL